jgi:hypothetical protein
MENRRGEEDEAKVPLLLWEEEDDDSSRTLGRRAWEENKKLWVVAGPSIFTRFSCFGVTYLAISLWYIPVMFSYVWSFTLQMYLQAQSKNVIITYLAMLNLGLHLTLSWLMVVKFRLGLAGVMGSMVIAMWIPVLGQLAFVFFGGCPMTWTGFSSAALIDLAAIINLSLSSGVMLW